MLSKTTGRVEVSRRRFLRIADLAGLGGLATALSTCSSGEPVEPLAAPERPTSVPASELM